MLTYIIWDINPDIFTIPYLDHPIRWYGLAWAVGLFISLQIMTFIYKKENRTIKEVDTMTFYLIIGTLVGARLGHILFYDPVYYFQNPLEILFIWEGGLASHGAAIGILLVTYFFARKTKVEYLWILDRLVIITALSGFFIRIGNLMNSEMAGLPTTLPWGVVFTSIDDVPRHPAQVYEAIYCLILFVLSFTLWAKFRDRINNGFIIGGFLIILFTLRFVDEFFKMNQVAFEDDMVLNMGQILSIPFVLIGIVILILSIGKKDKMISSERIIIK